MGKAALFSEAPVDAPSGTKRPGTVVIECSACGTSTRVSYVDFAVNSLPFSLWLPPMPALHFNRRMNCPACSEWAWVRAHWLA